MKKSRDYNKVGRDTEEHEYAYDFDLQVMHKYMLRTFDPFLRGGTALELGCSKGDFTSRLLTLFDSVDVVEASSDSAEHTKSRLGERVHMKRVAGKKIRQRFSYACSRAFR